MSTLTSEIILVRLTTLIKDCQNNIRGDFLGGPVAKTLRSTCEGPGFNPCGARA